MNTRRVAASASFGAVYGSTTETDAERIERIILDTRDGDLPMTSYDFAWVIARLRGFTQEDYDQIRQLRAAVEGPLEDGIMDAILYLNEKGSDPVEAMDRLGKALAEWRTLAQPHPSVWREPPGAPADDCPHRRAVFRWNDDTGVWEMELWLPARPRRLGYVVERQNDGAAFLAPHGGLFTTRDLAAEAAARWHGVNGLRYLPRPVYAEELPA